VRAVLVKWLGAGAITGLLVLPFFLWGCVSGSGGGHAASGPPEVPARPGTRVVALEYLQSFENEAGAVYFPLEDLARCAYSSDGTLVICDSGRGKVFGLDPRTRDWFEFDQPMVRPYRPVDVQVDGFKVLVLDNGSSSVFRFDLYGAYQDQILDIGNVDPGVISQGIAFDIDRDGRMVIADQAQRRVVLLDAFLSLDMQLGESGTSDDQFGFLGGLCFLPDGGILVSDPGNRRLCLYGRLGFFEGVIGGDFDPHNPFATPGGLDSDRFGNVFVADTGNALIHVLGPRLDLVFSAGREFPLRGTPTAPVDVAVGPDDLLAVTDQARSAIIIYRIIYE